MRMKPMVYGEAQGLLYHETTEYDGLTYEIAIVNRRGSSPCAYIRIPDEAFASEFTIENLSHAEYPENYIYANVHGGVTYAEDGKPFDDDALTEGFWIGWDYAHFDDYTWYEFRDPHPYEKTWTTKEIYEEAVDAIPTIEIYE